MLAMLAQRETPVMELAESFEMTLSAVSQHLTVLRQAGLVSQRKLGKQRLYSLNPEPLRLVEDWLSFYEPFWNSRLGQLGRYLDAAQAESNRKEP
jgi:DNA-binding transcriptional ArsR family regulator